MLELVRYKDLGAGADPDPITQPAKDAYGDLMAAKGGRVLIQAWLVDANGKPVDGSAVDVDLVVATYSVADPADRPTPTTTKIQAAGWGRGEISTTQKAGVWQTQAELGAAVGFTVAVTTITAPGAGTLAIYAELDPRGEVP